MQSPGQNILQLEGDCCEHGREKEGIVFCSFNNNIISHFCPEE